MKNLLVECCSCNGILHSISRVHLTSSISVTKQLKYSALSSCFWPNYCTNKNVKFCERFNRSSWPAYKFHTTAHTHAQVNPHAGHLQDSIPTWRPPHGQRTHTTTHAAKTPERTPFQPHVSTTIYHPIRDRDHTYTSPPDTSPLSLPQILHWHH